MGEVRTILPGQKIPQEYYDCRYAILRAPLGFARGAELLPDDHEALHVYLERDGLVIGVARAHLIREGEDGSAADHAGKDAKKCPGFTPLEQDSSAYRPAIQIRQMGVRKQYRRQGLASVILQELENKCAEIFDAKFGFLQARIAAVEFYSSQNWQIISDEYLIENVGPHYSMMKTI